MVKYACIGSVWYGIFEEDCLNVSIYISIVFNNFSYIKLNGNGLYTFYNTDTQKVISIIKQLKSRLNVEW